MLSGHSFSYICSRRKPLNNRPDIECLSHKVITVKAMVNQSSPSPFLAACFGEAHERVPVWFMRQAGRSLPEYRALRGADSILTAIADADLATEITLQPVRRYGVDAAILFSDIMVPVHAVGFGVDIQAGVGPVIAEPFADEAGPQSGDVVCVARSA